VPLFSYGDITITGPLTIHVEAKRDVFYGDDPNFTADENAAWAADDRAMAELGIPPDCEVRITYNVDAPYEADRPHAERDGRYAAIEVNVKSPFHDDITSTALSRISFPRILRAATGQLAGEFAVRTVDADTGDLVTRSFGEPRELGVAGCWAYGRLLGADPTRYVAEAFGISRTAAAQRVSRARNVDHQLPPTGKGER
jgi:hypothetical protein